MTIIWTQNGIVENDPGRASTDDLESPGVTGGPRLLSLAEALEQAGQNAHRSEWCCSPPTTCCRSHPCSTALSIVALISRLQRRARAFSQAMLLRNRLGYRGELRAIGTGAARPGAVDAADRV
jgi:uncharacterized protein (DUF934 family)